MFSSSDHERVHGTIARIMIKKKECPKFFHASIVKSEIIAQRNTITTDIERISLLTTGFGVSIVVFMCRLYSINHVEYTHSKGFDCLQRRPPSCVQNDFPWRLNTGPSFGFFFDGFSRCWFGFGRKRLRLAHTAVSVEHHAGFDGDNGGLDITGNFRRRINFDSLDGLDMSVYRSLDNGGADPD